MAGTDQKSTNAVFRLTRQRQAILEELRRINSHLTADEVYKRVKRYLPRVSLGTVYRNLEMLSRQGLIRKIELAGHQKMFDGDLSKHYHLRCMNCQGVVDVPVNKILIDFRLLDEEGVLKITGYHLELQGLCRQCQAVKEKSS
jgi:Fur family ferric uptake transcriptional regulator